MLKLQEETKACRLVITDNAFEQIVASSDGEKVALVSRIKLPGGEYATRVIILNPQESQTVEDFLHRVNRRGGRYD